MMTEEEFVQLAFTLNREDRHELQLFKPSEVYNFKDQLADLNVGQSFRSLQRIIENFKKTGDKQIPFFHRFTDCTCQTLFHIPTLVKHKNSLPTNKNKCKEFLDGI